MQTSIDSALAFASDFTEVYKNCRSEHPALREAHCLELLLPTLFRPIEAGDILAGRVAYPLVAFGPEPGGLGYHCREAELRDLAATGDTAEERRKAEDLLFFWQAESTAAKCRTAYPPHVAAALPSDAWTTDSGLAFPLYRMAGLTPDFGKLLSLGLPGLREAVASAASLQGESELRMAMLKALDLLGDIAERYAKQAEVRGLDILAAALDAISKRPPRTFLEAVQLFWLYALCSGSWNYGRMDVYLGPFLCRALDSGELSEAEALEYLCALWKLIQAYDNPYNNRVYVGGKLRPSESEADRFALLAMEATRRVGGGQPQLSLRFYEGQNPSLMKKALDLIGEGRTFPILYNDEANVAAISKAMSVPAEEAAQYTPFGCGEFVLEHRGIGSPNGVLNLLKVLEATLHGGKDPVTGRPWGKPAPDGFLNFDELWKDYSTRVEYFLGALAEQEKIEYEVAGREASFLFQSILHDDCLERGKAALSGGLRYLGGTVETYGNTNVADSLTAIRRLVFESRRLGLDELVRACDADFEDCENLRQLLLAAPKYGNDDEDADAMAARVHEHVCAAAMSQARRHGLDSYLVVVINNWANALFGRTTLASADGRRAWTAMANANNPAPGMDHGGPTAFLNSLVKLESSIHAGTVQNMKFSKRLFAERRPKLEALLGGYFRNGGTQAMITVVSRRDLESALAEPEKWGGLMVRVGGFSARYVELPRETQLEILSRTLYD